MALFKAEDIVRATKGSLVCGNPETVIDCVSIDSRKTGKNCLFVPLRGENTDGHNYIKSAFENGAVAAVSEVSVSYGDKAVIVVENTKTALQQLAAYYRSTLSAPFIGITGSVGKTTTKDMIAAVLSCGFKVHKTQGNYNNELGVPLTLLAAPPESEIAVTEMGMSGFGEIDRLVRLIRPEVAIITNIGISHIEKLGSQENILKAKLEILNGLQDEGLCILNGDDPLLYGLNHTLECETVYYGINNKKCDFTAYDVEALSEITKFKTIVDNREYEINLPVPGEHNVYNALAAIICGLRFNLSMNTIAEGLASFVPSGMRLNILENNGVKYIVDCYNASPASVKAAVNVLKTMECDGRRICALGDMLELGSFSDNAHLEAGRYAAEQGMDILIAVGEKGKLIAEGARLAGMAEVYTVPSSIAARETVMSICHDRDIVLVKGSRGMKMELVLPEGLI